MARFIREEWKEERLAELGEYLERGIIPAPQVFTWNASCKWYILQLVEKNIPNRVIQRGAGVKEVVIEKERCEHCKGKGYV